MDLKTFVSQSLIQIAEGIKEAQEANTGAWIAPDLQRNDKGLVAVDGANSPIAQMIKFDVAVTVSSQKNKEGKASLVVAWLDIGGGIGKNSENSVISRVQFELPVAWPKTAKPTSRTR